MGSRQASADSRGPAGRSAAVERTRAQPPVALPPQASEPAAILALQRAVGNRAVGRLLARQAHAPAATTPALQRRISFDIGGQITFNNIDHLKQSLKAIFAEAHHDEIDTLVDDAEALAGRPIGAVNVFNQIRGIAAQRGWERVVVAMPSGATHGPTLPVRDAHDTKEDKEAAMGTFMFSSVTLARATLTLPNRKTVSFESRNNTASGDHAEDGLMAQIDEYLASNRIAPARCRLRITINNAPCGTGRGEKNCAGNLAGYQARHGFGYFRVYFMSPYGSDMPGSVGRMRRGGIRVGSFAPKDMDLSRSDYSKGTWAKIEEQERFTPSGYALDPLSGSESEHESDSSDSDSRSPSPPRRRGRSRRRAYSPDSASPPRKPKQEHKKRKPSRSRSKKRSRAKQPRRSPRLQELPALEGLNLDDLRQFEDVAVDILSGPVVLNGYQVAALVDLLGDPVGRYVYAGGVQLRVMRGRNPLPKTGYNPTGLALVLIRSLRGG